MMFFNAPPISTPDDVGCCRTDGSAERSEVLPGPARPRHGRIRRGGDHRGRQLASASSLAKLGPESTTIWRRVRQLRAASTCGHAKQRCPLRVPSSRSRSYAHAGRCVWRRRAESSPRHPCDGTADHHESPRRTAIGRSHVARWRQRRRKRRCQASILQCSRATRAHARRARRGVARPQTYIVTRTRPRCTANAVPQLPDANHADLRHGVRCSTRLPRSVLDETVSRDSALLAVPEQDRTMPASDQGCGDRCRTRAIGPVSCPLEMRAEPATIDRDDRSERDDSACVADHDRTNAARRDLRRGSA